jgi:uncharacterized protein (DUF1501 family)
MSKPPTRRDFFRRTSCAALGLAGMSAGMRRLGLMTAYAQSQPVVSDYRALVCIFLSGGNDGNNMVVPMNPSDYNLYVMSRGATALGLGGVGQPQLLPITPPSIGLQFGLHPNLPELQGLFNQQKLAIVPNVGPLVQPLTRTQYRAGAPRPYQLFSHSDQVTQWSTSRSDTRTQIGWGGRTADFTFSLNGGSGFPTVTSVAGTAVFAQGLQTRPLSVNPAPTALNQLLVLNGFTTAPEAVARRNSMDFLRTIDRQAAMIAATSDSMQQAVDISAAMSVDPVLTTVFPNTGLGNQLKQVAKIMKLNQTAVQLNLRRQIFFCTLGGFDTHQDQPANQGSLFTQLSIAMKAFYDATVELGIASSVTTFTLSDFGRTLQPAGAGGTVGTDHGWGNHQFVMGGSVLGGNFYGVPGSNGTPFPTLQLSGPDDTDTRGRWIPTSSVDQYAATLATWFGVAGPDLPTVFPLLGRFTTPNLGFV